MNTRRATVPASMNLTRTHVAAIIAAAILVGLVGAYVLWGIVLDVNL